MVELERSLMSRLREGEWVPALASMDQEEGTFHWERQTSFLQNEGGEPEPGLLQSHSMV